MPKHELMMFKVWNDNAQRRRDGRERPASGLILARHSKESHSSNHPHVLLTSSLLLSRKVCVAWLGVHLVNVLSTSLDSSTPLSGQFTALSHQLLALSVQLLALSVQLPALSVQLVSLSGLAIMSQKSNPSIVRSIAKDIADYM